MPLAAIDASSSFPHGSGSSQVRVVGSRGQPEPNPVSQFSPSSYGTHPTVYDEAAHGHLLRAGVKDEIDRVTRQQPHRCLNEQALW